MNLTRRQLLVGAAAIPAAAALPALAGPPERVTAHPFLGLQHDCDRIRAVRCLCAPMQPRPESLSPFDIGRFYTTRSPDSAPPDWYTVATRSLGDRVLDLQDAEDRVLQRIFTDVPATATWDATAWAEGLNRPPSPYFLGSDPVSLFLLMNRGANIVASKSRRGRGTVALMHPSDLKHLTPYLGDSLEAPAEPTRLGRWTNRGSLIGSGKPLFTVWAGPVPQGRIVMLYKGPEFDALAYYSETPTGRHLTWMPEGQTTAGRTLYGTATDYASVIRIDTPPPLRFV